MALVALAGCGSEPANAPPEVLYGESSCAECGMIVNDERYATATIIEGDRGPEPRVFDDFNCQINFEADGAVPVVISRWVHDHESRAWLPAESAHYVRSPRLRTPMASGVAAFAEPDDAKRVASELEGEALTVAELWERAFPLDE